MRHQDTSKSVNKKRDCKFDIFFFLLVCSINSLLGFNCTPFFTIYICILGSTMNVLSKAEKYN
jgi:hypothetical protein